MTTPLNLTVIYHLNNWCTWMVQLFAGSSSVVLVFVTNSTFDMEYFYHLYINIIFKRKTHCNTSSYIKPTTDIMRSVGGDREKGRLHNHVSALVSYTIHVRTIWEGKRKETLGVNSSSDGKGKELSDLRLKPFFVTSFFCVFTWPSGSISPE